MSDDDLVDLVVASPRGHIVAAAGCGKTELIAKAVKATTSGPQLVLTHTHAGVDALRRRMYRLGVPPSAFHLETIAGWALRYAVAYPGMSGFSKAIPSGDDWQDVYAAAARMVQLRVVRRVIKATHAGVFVDEYQDCGKQQHQLILALAELLPVRVLGDPLQGIFTFRKAEPPVRWIEDVEAHFPFLERLQTPYRWKDKNPALGDWLVRARAALEAGAPLDLNGAPVKHTRLDSDWQLRQKAQFDACVRSLDAGERCVAIHGLPPQCHAAARCLRGIYSVVEPIDLEEMFTAADEFESKSGPELAEAVVEFAKACMTKVSTEMKPLLAAIRKGKPRSNASKNAEQYTALRSVAEQGGAANIFAALNALVRTDQSVGFRRELLGEMKRALKEKTAHPEVSLRDAAWTARERTRHMGRLLPRYAMGRTHLIKGLEFDHAIVLDADSLSRKNLYVAITRGVRSLTILSNKQTLTPKAD